MVNNQIFIRRKNKLYIESGKAQEVTIAHIGALLKNLEPLGYLLSNEIIERLMTISLTELGIFERKIVKDLEKLLGADVKYQPMYPNFPRQVMELSEAQLYFNAILHYYSNGTIFPVYKIEERKKLEEYRIQTIKLKQITLGTKEEFAQIMLDLMNSKSSISETDKEDLRWFLTYEEEIENYLPNDFFLHENKAFVCAVLLERISQTSERPIENKRKIAKKNLLEKEIQNEEKIQRLLLKYLHTATDVLRLACAVSNGDISLAKPCMFRKINRKERRIFLNLLNQCNGIEEDMKRYKERWIRLGERLHPGEYKGYKKARRAFEKLRNHKTILTFSGQIEKYLREKELEKIISLCQSRPGEFARRLDELLRNFDEKEQIIKAFKEVSGQIATPVLLQVRAHFAARNQEKKEFRVFFPKGMTAKAYVIKNNMKKMDEVYCKKIVGICNQALLSAYSELEPLGKVYINTELCNYLVPFSQRSAQRALKTIVRGSRIAINQETNIIRSFIYWREKEERVDIDLSAVILSKNWNWLDHISFTRLKSEKIKACHSGDIVSAPNGASEFIDIDLNTAIASGARYIVFTVNSYTEQKFFELPECFMGYMEREKLGKTDRNGNCIEMGSKLAIENPKNYQKIQQEIYEPKTVKNKIDLTANTQICIPMLIDLKEHCIVWMDMALKKTPNFNCVENNEKGIVALCKALVNSKDKTNLFDLLLLHAAARGQYIIKKEEADLIFDIDDGITPFDTEVFLANYI